MDNETCPDCNKKYKNLKLHIVKKHKKALCLGCEEWKPLEGFVNELEGKKKGGLCNAGLCEDCFT